MKAKILVFKLVALISSAMAHSAHSEGYHSQEQNLLPQVNPVLVGSILMTVIGLAALAFSYRKYRKES